MRLTRYLFLAIAGLFLSFQATNVALGQSQKGIPSDGRDFYFAQMSSSMDCAAITPFQSYWVVVCSYYDCNVTVSYFDQVTGEEFTDKTYKVFAKNFVQIPINTSNTIVHDLNGKNLNIDGEVAENTAIHVHADRPINVQYFSTGPDDCEMYLALPTSALGKHYVVAAAPNDDGTGGGIPRGCSTQPEPSSSFFGIVAVKDGTNVTIRPSGTTRKAMIPGATSGPGSNSTPNSINVSLKRGQVYWVKSEIKTGPGLWDIDMTGSQVDADQPVGVIAGCENAFNGNTALGINDNRNLNLEMMVPYDYWATGGYLVMPMKDTPGIQPSNNSAGDQVKVIVGDKSPDGCQVHAYLGELGPRDNSVQPYQFPPLTYDNVLDGSYVSSQCDQKIFVEQYDYRAIESRGERMATAPTMVNVVPASRYRTSMMWSVPDDVLQVAKYRFINVIANSTVFSKIKLWKDGKPIGFMSSLASKGSTTFPKPYEHMVGRTYEVGVGCYYATCDSAFAVYQYGMSAYDYPDKDLGDFDNDDYFHAYATPCGQSFGIDGAYSPKITVDTICDGRPFWLVHVRDTAVVDNFISAVDILRDNLGVIKRRPDADSGYTSYNVDFDPVNFTVVPGLQTAVDAKIVVTNPLKKAEAWVWAVNGAGNDTLVYLKYNPPAMDFGALTSNSGNDNLEFKKVPLGVDTCSYFVFKNTATTGQPFHLKSVDFALGGQGFTASTNPALPATMGPGDSVTIRVCFNQTTGGRTFFDTLIAHTECPSAIGYIVGSTTTPEINAEDHDFGAVKINDTVCYAVKVWNSGKADFVLDKTWVMKTYHDPNFTFKDADRLPLTVKPGESVYLNICYSPSDDVTLDTALVTWGTNMSEDIKHTIKDYSFLYGRGIKPSLTWDTAFWNVVVECDQRDTFRVWLRNYGTADIHVDTVGFEGEPGKLQTASQWKIVANQLNRTPLANFGLQADPSPKHDSIWVDVEFTPDRSLGLSTDAKLVAYDGEGIHPVVNLHATVLYAAMTISPANINFGVLSPGQLSGVQFVTIKDTGTAPLIIRSEDIPPPFMIVGQPGNLNVGDTLKPGESGKIAIQVQTNNPTETGNLIVGAYTACAPSVQTIATVSTAQIVPGLTGATFGTTYICKNGVQQVTATASGAGYKLVLDSVVIIDDLTNPAYSGESAEFVFDQTLGSTIKNINLTMAGGEQKTFDVRYTPSTTGAKHAIVRSYFHREDDATLTSTVEAPIIGSGAQEHTVLSVAKDPTNPTLAYNHIKDEDFVMPISMTQVIGATANVTKITFDVTFKQDQFAPAGPGGTYLTAPAGYAISENTTVTNGMTTVHATLQASAVLSAPGKLADLSVKVMIAPVKSTPIEVSNVAFYAPNDPTPLCYVAHDTIPGVFAPTDVCGDTTLRYFMMTDKLRFTIGKVSPIPATTTVSMGVDVAEDGIPVTVELFNVMGETVRTYNNGTPMAAGHQKLALDLTGLAEGTYTVRVSAPGQVGTQMILIQR